MYAYPGTVQGEGQTVKQINKKKAKCNIIAYYEYYVGCLHLWIICLEIPIIGSWCISKLLAGVLQ